METATTPSGATARSEGRQRAGGPPPGASTELLNHSPGQSASGTITLMLESWWCCWPHRGWIARLIYQAWWLRCFGGSQRLKLELAVPAGVPKDIVGL